MVQTRSKVAKPNLQKGKAVSNATPRTLARAATRTVEQSSSTKNDEGRKDSSASKPKKRVVAITTRGSKTATAQSKILASKHKKSKREDDVVSTTTHATVNKTKIKSSKPPPLTVRKKTAPTKSTQSHKESEDEASTSPAGKTNNRSARVKSKSKGKSKSKSKGSKQPSPQKKAQSAKSKKSNLSASDAQAANATKSTKAKSKKVKKVDKLFKDASTPKVISKAEKQASAAFAKEDAAGPSRILSKNEVLKLGLLYVSDDISRSRAKQSTHINSFKKLYGSDPAVIAKIWNELQTTTVKEAKIDGVSACLKGFFITMHFLKRYATETEQAVHFKSSENTVRKWRWFYIARLRALKKVKIVWPDEWVNGGKNRPIILLTVDGVHIRIQEPQHERYSKNPKFCSHKFHTSAVNYEVALDLAKSRIVHINGPFEASTHDITIFRQELLQKIPEGHFCIADRGYTGEPDKVMGPNSHDTEQVRKFKGRARS